MIPSRDSIHRAILYTLILALVVTAAFMLTTSPVKAVLDPDAVITDVTITAIAVLVFTLTWKYKNVLLELGLALIVYATCTHLIEEATVEFSPVALLLYAILLAAGFTLLSVAALKSVERMDLQVERLQEQEALLVARARDEAELRATLEQTNRKLRLLSRITRHDLSNRLLAARGFLRLLQRENVSAEMRARYVARADQALRTTASIISFARDYEEIGIAAPAWREVAPLIDAAWRALERNGVTFENAVERNLEVCADAMIGKVFYNLADNALSHGGEGLNRIRFFTQEGPGGLTLVCEDNGNGIAPEEKERIFERGFGKQTGLGLFLSREILSLTGIAIREAGSPGTGARFEILVPAGKYRRRE